MTQIQFNRTKALNHFKDLIGQTNHFLITILIGLDGVEKKTVTASQDFSTSWNPKDVTSSVRRSRQFAIKATLSWIVDAMDAYFILANRTPKLIPHGSFSSQFDSARQSVSKKLDAFRDNLTTCLDVEYALAKLAITWRNRLVHSLADNEFHDELRVILQNPDNKDYIQATYRGLNIDDLLSSFDSSLRSVPKFKEIAAFVSATIRLVTSIDAQLIELSKESYLNEIVRAYVIGDSDLGAAEDKESRLRRVEGIWSKNDELKARKLKNVFVQYGCQIPDGHPILTYYSDMKLKDALDAFGLKS